jgi:hypothetical protein
MKREQKPFNSPTIPRIFCIGKSANLPLSLAWAPRRHKMIEKHELNAKPHKFVVDFEQVSQA